MIKYPKLTHFVSEIDQLLQQFDKNNLNNLSLTQKKERDKHLAVSKKRDTAFVEQSTKIWRNF